MKYFPYISIVVLLGGFLLMRISGIDIRWYSEICIVVISAIIFYHYVAFQKMNKKITKLSDLVVRDGLTGLFNQKSFKKKLQDEIYRAERLQTNIGVLFLDIDQFKKINDQFGHTFGDFILRESASIITNIVRKIDIVARYGGDEFSVILINANEVVSQKIAERIVKGLESKVFLHNEQKSKIKVSIGVSTYPKKGTEAEKLIHWADQSMFRKKTG